MTHRHPAGAATVEVKCQRCKRPFTARVADRQRGWGKFCSKSCKAIKQTQRTGYAGPRAHDDRGRHRDDWDRYADTVHPFSSEAFEQ